MAGMAHPDGWSERGRLRRPLTRRTLLMSPKPRSQVTALPHLRRGGSVWVLLLTSREIRFQRLRATTRSKTFRTSPLSRKRPWRFLGKVGWSGTRPSSPRRQNQRWARFRSTSSQRRRSERMP